MMAKDIQEWDVKEVIDEFENEGGDGGVMRAKRIVLVRMECVSEASAEAVNEEKAERPTVPKPLKVDDTLVQTI